jgi:hypothetical protein
MIMMKRAEYKHSTTSCVGSSWLPPEAIFFFCCSDSLISSCAHGSDRVSTSGPFDTYHHSYFTTGSLPSISSFCRLTFCDSRPVIIFLMNPCGHSPYVTSSLTRGWDCRLQLLMVLASAVIFGSESCLRFETPPTWRTRYFPGTGFPFHRLLRLTGLRWKYCNPPPHGLTKHLISSPAFI